MSRITSFKKHFSKKESFVGKTILVTGGSRGIGKSIALEFARLGANIALNYVRNEKSALATQTEIRKTGAKVILVKADITKEEEIREMLKRVVKEFGSLEILVNNADDGRFEFAPPMKIKSEDWSLILKGSLLTVFYCCKHVLPMFISNKYGRIINIAAAGGDKVEIAALCLPYYIAKEGVINFTRVLASSVAKHNITINSVAPAFVENYDYPSDVRKRLLKQIPMNRFAKTDEVAKAVVFLAGDDAKYITGINLVVGGGSG